MKYEDIAKLFKKREAKIKMAVRVYQAKPFIREAIDKWLETGDEPCLEIYVAPQGTQGKSMLLSAQSLIHSFDMAPLEALLFMDGAIRDDAGAYEALNHLAYCRTKPFTLEVTEEMLRGVDPELREEYENMRAEEEKKLKKLEQIYNEINEEELYQ